MACALTQSLNLDCRDSFGGLKRVLLIEFDNVTDLTFTAGVVSAITRASTKVFYQYKLIAYTGEGKSDGTHSRENGTNMYKHAVSFPINKMTTAVKSEIELLAQNRLLIIVEDNNGRYWLYGKDFGMMLVTSTATTGVALGDRNGYTLAFESDEKAMPVEVDKDIIPSLLTP